LHCRCQNCLAWLLYFSLQAGPQCFHLCVGCVHCQHFPYLFHFHGMATQFNLRSNEV
jgi:hypothetical protein